MYTLTENEIETHWYMYFNLPKIINIVNLAGLLLYMFQSKEVYQQYSDSMLILKNYPEGAIIVFVCVYMSQNKENNVPFISKWT